MTGTRAGEAPPKQPARIAAMFDAIAPRYDTLNHLLSVGLDRRWRRRAIRALALTRGDILLDVCTGTGDLALAAAHDPDAPPAAAIGVDFAAAMLAIARRKALRTRQGRSVRLVRADATRLPLASESVQAAAVAFGIRNVEEPGRALEEIRRVLRPGGRLVILEFGFPGIPGVRRLYLWYFRYLLPRIGRAVSGHQDAYGYLPASVGAFPSAGAFAAFVREAGFAEVRHVPLTLGIVYLYTAVRE